MIICNKFRSRGNSHHDVSDIIFNIFLPFYGLILDTRINPNNIVVIYIQTLA